jgi:hypothetical protein
MSEDKKTILRSEENVPVVREHTGGASLTKTENGREVWLFTVGGRLVNVTTSNSSAAIMDDALRIYSPALKRLAKK